MSIFVLLVCRMLDNLIVYISIYCSILPAASLLSKSIKWPLKIIGVYSIYSILSDLFLSKISQRLFGTEIISYRFFTLVEFALFCSYLYFSINQKKFKKIIPIAVLIFTISVIIDLSNLSFNDFDSLPTGIESIIILSLSILCLSEILNSSDLFRKPKAWISFGLILYFSGSFFLFILSKNNLNNQEFANQYAIIISIFNIVKNISFFIAILVERKFNLNFNYNSKIA